MFPKLPGKKVSMLFSGIDKNKDHYLLMIKIICQEDFK